MYIGKSVKSEIDISSSSSQPKGKLSKDSTRNSPCQRGLDSCVASSSTHKTKAIFLVRVGS
jgi:hypothetical protein